jgi:hypothetical protein
MPRVAPAKRYLALVHRHQAMGADGDPMGRAAQVRHHLLGRGNRRLGIDHPGVLPQLGQEVGKGLGVSQGGGRAGKTQGSPGVSPVEAGEIFPPQDLAEPLDREEEVAVLGGHPARAVRGESPTRDDAVDMDVMLEGLPPGMEHQGEADLPAEPPGITAKGLQGGCGALEEEAVEQLGVALGQGIEFVWQSQDTMEIGDVSQLGATRLDPAQLGQGLALGTMAIATRVVPQDLGPTPVALRQVAPQGRGTARLDGLHHPQLLAREAMRGAIGLAVGTEDVGDLGSGLSARLGGAVATPGTTGLRMTGDAIAGHQGVDGAHEGLLESPNVCDPVRAPLR